MLGHVQMGGGKGPDGLDPIGNQQVTDLLRGGGGAKCCTLEIREPAVHAPAPAGSAS